MITSFFTSVGFFCVSWTEKGVSNAIWTGSITKAIQTYFKIKAKKQQTRLLYFSSEGELKTIGGGT